MNKIRTMTVNGVEMRVDVDLLRQQQLHLIDLQDLTNEHEDQDIFDTYSGVINFLGGVLDVLDEGKLL
jgi:hypothetical protein